MPLFGTDLDKIIDTKTDRSFSAYFNNTKKNQILQESVIDHIDLLYATNDKGRIRDDLFSLNRTGVSFPVTNNTVSLTTAITDYDHFMDGLVSMVEDMNLTVVGATIKYLKPVIVKFNRILNLRTGDKLNFSGVLGTTEINGIRYINMINSTQGELFTDAKLTIPVTSNNAYISGGTVQRYVDNWVQENNQKTAALGRPSLYYPKYEIANGLLKIKPLEITCAAILVDYIAKPTVFPDVTNSAIDLLLTYSNRFVYDIADTVAQKMGFDSRDSGLVQNSTAQLIQQP